MGASLSHYICGKQSRGDYRALSTSEDDFEYLDTDCCAIAAPVIGPDMLLFHLPSLDEIAASTGSETRDTCLLQRLDKPSIPPVILRTTPVRRATAKACNWLDLKREAITLSNVNLQDKPQKCCCLVVFPDRLCVVHHSQFWHNGKRSLRRSQSNIW